QAPPKKSDRVLPAGSTIGHRAIPRYPLEPDALRTFLGEGSPVRRVVATGLGVVSPLGIGIDAFWGHLSRGVSGVRRITKFDPAGLPSELAVEVLGVEAEMYLARRDVGRTD